jgi:nitrate/TMAO reductase-like tetraheme cytochrome c subunit
MQGRHQGLIRHPVSLVGVTLVVLSLINIVFVVLLDVLGNRANPYLGIFAYIIFPAILIMGLVLISVGMLLERRRRRRLAPTEIPPYPRIDLNNPRHQVVCIVVMGLTMFFLLMSAVGSYRAYEYTESVSFCGALCHTVMEPEYTAYQASPHARVPCVDCHVGPGATWYVRAKLTGLYQVYAAALDKYPRPIPTPIESLRPARETCEQCHWPEKFFGAQLKVITHFGTDEHNTPRPIRMLIKTGGGSPTTGLTAGIHWHMNIANQIWYIATDAKRQVIPWVRVQDRQGRVTEYLAENASLTPAEVETMPKRRMDCIDCHNRPTHIFLPPNRAVDEALLAGRIDPSLAFVKQQAVEALTKPYPSTDAAMEGIATDVKAFYQSRYPDLYSQRQEAIQESIGEVQRIFRANIFPHMKVDWQTHAENLGHFYSPGCFRCHDGQHVSQEGKVIRKECDVCHTILGQEEGGTPIAPIQGEPFRHPIDLGDLTAVTCSDCHTGAGGP